MKKKTVKWAVFLALLLALILFCKWYTRPQPLEAFFPYPEEVTELQTHYRMNESSTGYETERCDLTLIPEEPKYQQLMELLQNARYSCSLRNLALNDSPKGDINEPFWQIDFITNPLPLPNGDTVGGTTFRVENQNGHLRLVRLLDGLVWYVNMDDAQAFRDAVAEILRPADNSES